MRIGFFTRALLVGLACVAVADTAAADPQFVYVNNGSLRKVEVEAGHDALPAYSFYYGTGDRTAGEDSICSDGMEHHWSYAIQTSDLQTSAIEFDCYSYTLNHGGALTSISSNFTVSETAVLSGTYTFWTSGYGGDLAAANFWVRVIDTSTDDPVFGHEGSADADGFHSVTLSDTVTRSPGTTYRLEVLCNSLNVGAELGAPDAEMDCSVSGLLTLSTPTP